MSGNVSLTSPFFSKIALCDGSVFFLKCAKKNLAAAGFNDVTLLQREEDLKSYLDVNSFTLLFINVYLNTYTGLDIAKDLRLAGYRGVIAMISSDFSLDIIEQSVWSGADDFIVKSDKLVISREVVHLLAADRGQPIPNTSEKMLDDSGFLRTIGLTPFERQLLDNFYPTLSSQKELAFKLHKSASYIRKTFSGIYRKFHVENHAQLVRILTFCSRFSTLRPPRVYSPTQRTESLSF